MIAVRIIHYWLRFCKRVNSYSLFCVDSVRSKRAGCLPAKFCKNVRSLGFRTRLEMRCDPCAKPWPTSGRKVPKRSRGKRTLLPFLFLFLLFPSLKSYSDLHLNYVICCVSLKAGAYTDSLIHIRNGGTKFGDAEAATNLKVIISSCVLEPIRVPMVCLPILVTFVC